MANKENWSDLEVFLGYTKPQLARIRKASPKLYEALKAMYKSWVVRPDDKVNVLIYKMAGEALTEAEGV